MNCISIPAFTDNYIWLLYNDDRQCLVVDPGEAEPVLQAIEEHQLTLVAILLTHHHHDHVGGVAELLRHFIATTYGPEEIHTNSAIKIVAEGDTLKLLNNTFSIMALPGHTLGHIGFYSAPWLFSGDTIFPAGCGRIFEGTPKQMYDSLQKINKLPPNTVICAAHEYTLSNLEFAAALLPQDSFIINYKRKIKELYLKNQLVLPITLTLHLARQINLFLRCHDINLQNKLNSYSPPGEEWHVFSTLREKKDCFNYFL